MTDIGTRANLPRLACLRTAGLREEVPGALPLWISHMVEPMAPLRASSRSLFLKLTLQSRLYGYGYSERPMSRLPAPVITRLPTLP